ncbi:hypothetical protein SDC9_204140 [bioreactor metagenome]|uniref:Uncharacterized protein n=1 Tax=bioreactor metagenome TaxID=1076179 RepID=A0A645IYP6_9ZZZZ
MGQAAKHIIHYYRLSHGGAANAKDTRHAGNKGEQYLAVGLQQGLQIADQGFKSSGFRNEINKRIKEHKHDKEPDHAAGAFHHRFK